jgi:hypothetical protein
MAFLEFLKLALFAITRNNGAPSASAQHEREHRAVHGAIWG